MLIERGASEPNGTIAGQANSRFVLYETRFPAIFAAVVELAVFPRYIPSIRLQGDILMFRHIAIAAFFLSSALFAVAATAADKGQEDLDKATETKLMASSITDLNEVIRLTETALEKGLDESNAAFAKKLLASTYIQRAQSGIENLFVDVASMEEFRNRRQAIMDDLNKAVKLEPKEPESYLMIARMELMPGGGGAKLAREALDKIISLDAADQTAKANAFLLRSSMQEEPDKTLADLNESVRLAPNNAAAVRARGLAMADMNKLELALADLDKAILLEPDNEPTYEAKAIVLASMKRFDEAIAVLQSAREMKPDSAAPLVQLARVHIAQKKLEDALADLDKAIVLQPENVAILLLRSGIYQELGKNKKALADVDKALKIRPGLIVGIRTRALLLADEERYGEATLELEKLRENDPGDLLTLMQLGSLYSVRKQSAKAIEAYSSILSAQPDVWQALRGRGDSYLNLGKHAEALADYEKALKLESKESGILNNFAWVLATSPDEKVRDGARAVKLATEACEASEYKLAHIASTLAAAYAESGDFESAKKWAEKAVELDEENEHGDELKKELESYKAGKPWRESLSEEKAEEGNGNGDGNN